MRGFILTGPLLLYGGIAAGVLILGMGAATWVQTQRLESCQEKFEAFKLQTKLLGEAAEAKAREREAADKKLKEKTDADHKLAVARLNRDLKRLRDDNASRSVLPAARPGASDPQSSCFSRADLDRAVSGFVGRTADLVGQGAEAVIGLDAAKAWAQALPQ